MTDAQGHTLRDYRECRRDWVENRRSRIEIENGRIGNWSARRRYESEALIDALRLRTALGLSKADPGRLSLR